MKDDIGLSEDSIGRKKFLSWQREIKIKWYFHELMLLKKGKAVKGYGGGWGLKDTAKSLHESIASVSQDINLAKALEGYPELKESKNKKEAMRKLRERENTKRKVEVVEL